MSATITPTMQWFEIPTTNANQKFTITLNGTVYTMTLMYRQADMGGWILDLGDANGNNLVCGIPLVTGVNLLEQYVYLGLNGVLEVSTDGDFFAPPTFDNLGTTAHLWFGVRAT